MEYVKNGGRATDWNGWRTDYPTTTLEQQHRFYSRIATEYPGQPHANLDNVTAFLDDTRPTTVLDLGGWDGRTAQDALAHSDFIQEWQNIEIAPGVAQVCNDPRYQYIVPERWVWETGFAADALIASHVLEHMLAWQIADFLNRSRFTHIYADVPILWDTPEDWHNFPGTHIIDISWSQLHELFVTAGYHCRHREATVAWYTNQPEGDRNG